MLNRRMVKSIIGVVSHNSVPIPHERFFRFSSFVLRLSDSSDFPILAQLFRFHTIYSFQFPSFCDYDTPRSLSHKAILRKKHAANIIFLNFLVLQKFENRTIGDLLLQPFG